MTGPWTGQPGEAELRRALASVAPDLADLPMRANPRHTQGNPLYHSASAWIDDRFVVKYAWSAVRAERHERERVVLQRLRSGADPLPVPEVVAWREDPTLLVTAAVPGVPLGWDASTGWVPGNLAMAGQQVGSLLARLHARSADEVLGGLPTVVPRAQSDTDRLRADFPRIVDDVRAATVLGWCEWVDEVFAAPGPDPVLVHGDLHGHNQVWDPASSSLVAVLDLEECGIADPHFDLRYLPGNAPSLALTLATIDAYERDSGLRLQVARVMAWHLLTVLGDALWRTEAGVELPGGGDAPEWVDDLRGRLVELGLP